MRIGIDARFLTHSQVGGFKTYSENLISALAEIDSKNEYILYLDRPPGRDSSVPGQPNFSTRIVRGTMPLLGMPWREQVGLPVQAARDKLHLLHSPSQTAPLGLRCPSVLTIYDMMWFFPKRLPRGGHGLGRRRIMESYYRFVSRLAARNASVILTVSEASKRDITACLTVNPDEVHVTYPAAGRIYRRVDDPERTRAMRSRRSLAGCFILAIGSADPRKNMPALVRAYASLPSSLQERHQLVIVWTHGFLVSDLARQVRALHIDSRVRFLEYVSNEELVLLYNAASLFVFPSLYEGFGLPPLEAMACGTPVVAANNSSIPEIAGDAAVLVDAEDCASIASGMARLLTDDSLQRKLVDKGLGRAATFSWERCARETVTVYEKALGGIARAL